MVGLQQYTVMMSVFFEKILKQNRNKIVYTLTKIVIIIIICCHFAYNSIGLYLKHVWLDYLFSVLVQLIQGFSYVKVKYSFKYPKYP